MPLSGGVQSGATKYLHPDGTFKSYPPPAPKPAASTVSYLEGGLNAPSTGVARSTTGSYGQIQQGSYDQQEQTRLESQLRQQEAERASAMKASATDRSLQAIKDLQGPASPTVPGLGGPGGVNEEAARAAAFARAKDQAGATANASLQSLRDVMDARGLFGGSTIEAQQTGNILGGAKGSVDEFTREQLIQDLNRSSDVADRNYAGALTQRGQDMNRQQALLGLLAAGGLY